MTPSAAPRSGSRRYVADTTLLLHRWIEDGAAVLFEGAQGTLLDVDHGTYPYVTTSQRVGGRGVPPAPACRPRASTACSA